MFSGGLGPSLFFFFIHLIAPLMHCYLEAQSESNVSLYEHYGFEVLAEGVVPNTDIPHWDMMRFPQ